MSEIADRYDPTRVEPHWYGIWEERGYFHADAQSPGKPYCIVIPPPNVTGTLHIGHAFTFTLQDVLVRYKRMDGYNALWMPGTDHAGIATQYVVERQLEKEGKTKEDLGREGFIARVWQWKEESGGTIIHQLKSLGASCDWARERFTMDPGLSAAVREVFVRLWEEGLIYQGDYIVNWCPRCQTVLSDLEVEREEQDAEFVYIKYGPLTLGTVRPETKLGDTAVAVHPKDKRYKKYVGKTLEVPSVEGNITLRVVADSAVDPKFGTGVIKVTPGHDATDFEIGRRHNLPIRSVIGFDGKMTALAGKYAGLDRFETRKRIVEDMKELGLIDRIEPYRHSVGVCYRCKTVVEPLVSKQWYVRTKPLAEPAIKAVRSGKIKIVPRAWSKTYFHWMENIRDWAISRQLWWGHRIPVWYCDKDGSMHVSRTDLSACPQCGGALRQDTDVLDTWFSSGLWPFSTLGWPESTADFRTYYPTSLLITGYDILFFWVARMIMLGLHFTGKVPFRTVYLHSIVRTPDGEKMSKSKGTGIDPIDVNRRYGTDAMRFTLAVTASVSDIIWTEERIQSSRNFANKIWNAARFLFVNLEKFEQAGGKIEDVAAPEVRDNAPYASGAEIELVDLWIFSRLGKAIVQNNEALASYRFHEAAQSVYHFFWGDFCDWYIEWVKPRLLDKNLARATAAWRNLFAVFERALRLLHPFMPFLTEELWQKLPQRAGIRSIALDRFPEAKSNRINQIVERNFSLLQRVITSVRVGRADNKIDAKRKIAAELSSQDVAVRELVEGNLEPIQRLAVLSSLLVTSNHLTGKGYFHNTPEFDAHIPFAEIINPEAEMTRLKKDREGLQKAIASKEAQLGNETFRSRAPEMIIKGLEATLAEQRIELRKLQDRLSQLE